MKVKTSVTLSEDLLEQLDRLLYILITVGYLSKQGYLDEQQLEGPSFGGDGGSEPQDGKIDSGRSAP